MDFWEHDKGFPQKSPYETILQNRMNLVNNHCDTSEQEPITFNSINKLWLGGTDILDYVVCYWTKGNPTQDVPDHWHYVTFGLSDFAGSALYHIYPLERFKPMGLGFELTFRVQSKRDEGPPIWPVDLLQKLARYCYASNSRLIPGDHVTWHSPLHGSDQPTAISHMLITKDATIPVLNTPSGPIMYNQIVGVTSDEVEIAQRWNVTPLLALFQRYKHMGGSALVTNPFRQQSIIDLYPEVKDLIAEGMATDGSNLNGVTARVLWTDKAWIFYDETNLWMLSPSDRKKYEDYQMEPEYSTKDGIDKQVSDIAELFGDASLEDTKPPPSSHLTNQPEQTSEEPFEIPTKYYSTVHLTMDTEAAVLITLALNGRVDHNRHFTFKDSVTDDAVTFVPDNMPGAFTSQEHPFAAKGVWLHIQLDQESRSTISRDLQNFFANAEISLPKNFLWAKSKFAVSILNKN